MAAQGLVSCPPLFKSVGEHNPPPQLLLLALTGLTWLWCPIPESVTGDNRTGLGMGHWLRLGDSPESWAVEPPCYEGKKLRYGSSNKIQNLLVQEEETT